MSFKEVHHRLRNTFLLPYKQDIQSFDVSTMLETYKWLLSVFDQKLTLDLSKSQTLVIVRLLRILKNLDLGHLINKSAQVVQHSVFVKVISALMDTIERRHGRNVNSCAIKVMKLYQFQKSHKNPGPVVLQKGSGVKVHTPNASTSNLKKDACNSSQNSINNSNPIPTGKTLPRTPFKNMPIVESEAKRQQNTTRTIHRKSVTKTPMGELSQKSFSRITDDVVLHVDSDKVFQKILIEITDPSFQKLCSKVGPFIYSVIREIKHLPSNISCDPKSLIDYLSKRNIIYDEFGSVHGVSKRSNCSVDSKGYGFDFSSETLNGELPQAKDDFLGVFSEGECAEGTPDVCVNKCSTPNVLSSVEGVLVPGIEEGTLNYFNFLTDSTVKKNVSKLEENDATETGTCENAEMNAPFEEYHKDNAEIKGDSSQLDMIDKDEPDASVPMEDHPKESKTTVDEEILLGVKCILAGKAHEIKDVKTIEIVESTCQALPNEVVGEIVGNKNEALSNHGQDLITGSSNNVAKKKRSKKNQDKLDTIEENILKTDILIQDDSSGIVRKINKSKSKQTKVNCTLQDVQEELPSKRKRKSIMVSDNVNESDKIKLKEITDPLIQHGLSVDNEKNEEPKLKQDNYCEQEGEGVFKAIDKTKKSRKRQTKVARDDHALGGTAEDLVEDEIELCPMGKENNPKLTGKVYNNVKPDFQEAPPAGIDERGKKNRKRPGKVINSDILELNQGDTVQKEICVANKSKRSRKQKIVLSSSNVEGKKLKSIPTGDVLKQGKKLYPAVDIEDHTECALPIGADTENHSKGRARRFASRKVLNYCEISP